MCHQILEFQQFLNVKLEQMIDGPLIKIFKFCVELA